MMLEYDKLGKTELKVYVALPRFLKRYSSTQFPGTENSAHFGGV